MAEGQYIYIVPNTVSTILEPGAIYFSGDLTTNYLVNEGMLHKTKFIS